MSATALELRLAFFDYLFDEREGFLCIAHAPAKDGKKKNFQQKFFMWPEQREAMGSYLDSIHTGNNVWFGVNLFRRPERKREYAIPTRLVWADLDYCDPGDITPAPQCRIESSPKRFQAFWRLDEVVDAEVAQSYSKRIAYQYAEEGADRSGWDIEQLLRVPFTYNYKYDDGAMHVPEVTLMTSFDVLLPVGVFEELTVKTEEEEIETDDPMPDVLALPDVGNVIYAHHANLRKTAFTDVYATEPLVDWSAAMWHLINICLESGMDRVETFAVCLSSKCNKYDRDDRPISYLWKEIIKADYKQKTINMLLDEAKPLKMPVLVDGDPPHSVIDDYKDWAIEATDAVVEYHELAAVMLLSSILSAGLYVKTSFGNVSPNLWGLILGDSTLTRKTTAMKMAMEFVGEIDREIVVATDGSVEGMLTALAARPNLVSVFYKDEISGFIDSINRKDYLAGMPETLTQLYDVPEFFTRRLRKETITITKPVFVFFGGGIRDKMYGLLNDEFILSGFLPRFLIVGGDADINKIRPTGPLPPNVGAKRSELKERFQDLHATYNEATRVDIPDANSYFEIPTQTEVELTDAAWKFFQDTEMLLTKEANDSAASMVALPTFSRLAWSSLKMGMLFAAARQKPNKDGKIKVEANDLRAAAWYVQKWGVHTIDLIQNVGRSANQRMVSRVYDHIRRRNGCTRSEISRYYHLQKRELDLILDTLIDRGQISVRKAGNGQTIHLVGQL